MVSCFTCNSVRHWSEVDCGHFMSRACMSTRWDPQNAKPQCKRCNGFRSGEQYLFAQHLDRLYGPGTADLVLARSKTLRKFSAEELLEMLKTYTDMAEDERAQRGI